jgi:hypothetical protein
MADDLGNPGNVDPWVGFADAPQPKGRWVTLVPVDHDPFADGGDLSGPSARRLPSERAVAPRGTALKGPGELEDPEAAAFAPRTGCEHIPFANAAIGMAALTEAPFKAARDMVHGAAESVERLGQQGYHPKIDDEQYKRQAAADSFMLLA